MNLLYDIDETSFVVNIFVSGNWTPVIHQPNWPNGTAWTSYLEAEDWAKACILSILEHDAPYAPAGPGLSGQPKVPS